MDKYLYIFRGGLPMGMGKTSPAEMQKQMQKWLSWMKELEQKGHLKGGDPLEDGGKTVRGKSKTITDGPFAEAKDVVGGYLLVTAESLDHAVELSKGCPILDIEGTVEVRKVHAMTPPAG
jgi:hypothetical protein